LEGAGEGVSSEIGRVGAAEAVARAWNARGVNYLVTHGLEGHPIELGRDLDILMDQAQAPRALRHASKTLTDLGWETVVSPPDLWGKRIVALHERNGGFDYLELHTTRPLRWALMRFTGAYESPDKTVGPFPVSAWVTFAKAVLLPLLAGDVGRFNATYLSELAEIGVTAELVADHAKPLLGTKLASQLASTTAALDVEGLIVLRPAVRRACLSWMLRHPISSLRSLHELAIVKVRRIWSRSGVDVLLEVPPRIDRQAFLESLRAELHGVFVQVKIQPQGAGVSRLWNQYQILSRQGVVLRLTDGSPDTAQVRARCRLRPFSTRSDAEIQLRWEHGGEGATGREIGSWTVKQWAQQFTFRVAAGDR
jgi:hypothetical protein